MESFLIAELIIFAVPKKKKIEFWNGREGLNLYIFR